MTHADSDLSVSNAKPIECYEFIGELRTYLYTSAPQQQVVAGKTFLPLAGISRSAIEVSSVLESIVTNDINVPYSSQLATDYNYKTMPTDLTVTIYEFNLGDDPAVDYDIIFSGEAVSFGGNNADYAVVRTQAVIQARFNGQLNQIVYQTPCNHLLYDSRCKVDPAANTFATTVVSFIGNRLTVASVGPFADGALVVGKIINTRTGERRVIVANTGTVVTIGYPLIDLLPGDPISLVRGCDLQYTTCKTVFNNVANFGGFKFMPSTNPYESEI